MDAIITNCDKSGVVKIIKNACGKTYKDIGAVLGTSTAYVNNKMHRNSWSVEDIGKVCKEFGAELVIRGENEFEVRVGE